MECKKGWNTFINILSIANIIYTTVDLYWQTHDRGFWNEPAPKIVSLTIGAVFTVLFLVNAFVRIFELRATDHSACESLCFYIEIFVAFVGLFLYILGTLLINLAMETRAADALLAIGWTIGATGHIFGLLGTCIKSRRQAVAIAQQLNEIEMH